MKKENANLKDSNENHIFINEKLNKALKKSEERIDKLTQKIKTITNESVVLPKSSLHVSAFGNSAPKEPAAKIIVEKGPGESGAAASNKDAQNLEFAPDMGDAGDDDFFGGDVSSIMIKPDQILND